MFINLKVPRTSSLVIALTIIFSFLQFKLSAAGAQVEDLSMKRLHSAACTGVDKIFGNKFQYSGKEKIFNIVSQSICKNSYNKEDLQLLNLLFKMTISRNKSNQLESLLRKYRKQRNIYKSVYNEITMKNAANYDQEGGFCKSKSSKLSAQDKALAEKGISQFLDKDFQYIKNTKLNHTAKFLLWDPWKISRKYKQEYTIKLLDIYKPIYSYNLGAEESEYRQPTHEDAQSAEILYSHILSKKIHKKNIPIELKMALLAGKGANLYWPLGKLDEAIQSYQHALSIAKSSENNSAKIHIYANLAYLSGETGDYQAMQNYYIEGLKSIGKLNEIDLEQLYWFVNVTKFYYNRFYSKPKLTIYPEFINAFINYIRLRSGKQSSDLGWALIETTSVAYDLGLIKGPIAISKLSRAIQILGKCSMEDKLDFDLSYAYYQKSRIEVTTGLFKNANVSLFKALPGLISSASVFNDYVAEALILYSRINFELGNYRIALNYALLGGMIMDLINGGYSLVLDSANAFGSAYSMGLASCLYLNDTNCIKILSKASISDYLSYLFLNIIYSSRESRDWLYLKSGANQSPLMAVDSLDQNKKLILENLISLKGITLQAEKEKTNYLSNKVASAKIKSLTFQLEHIKSNLSRRADDKNLELLRMLETKLEEQLRINNVVRKPIPVNSEQISSVLERGSVLIEFKRYNPYISGKFSKNHNYWGKSRYLAVLLNSNNVIEIFDLGLASKIDALIRKAILSTEQKHVDADNYWKNISRLTLSPFISSLKKYKTIYISPDSHLSSIPFALLPVNSNGKEEFLADQFNIRLISSGRDLLLLQRPNQRKLSKSLIVTNPDFEYQPNRKFIFSGLQKSRIRYQRQITWRPLPGSEQEGYVLSKLISGILLEGKNASLSNVLKYHSPKIVHIASHVFFQFPADKQVALNSSLNSNSENQNYSHSFNYYKLGGIALAGANYSPFNEDNNFGYLSSSRISRMNWLGTELVVISGCDSASEFINSGESYYGMRRSISISGARSSLLSLWKVDDQTARVFMDYFYRQLLMGVDRDKAVLLTQKFFRSHENHELRHPYYWAGFQLYGDWRPIYDL